MLLVGPGLGPSPSVVLASTCRYTLPLDRSETVAPSVRMTFTLPGDLVVEGVVRPK